MSHELSYDSELGCIVLHIEGKVTVEVIRELAPEVASMVEETGCRRILNDMSVATIDVAVMDLFDSPKIMSESGIASDTKRALVVPCSFAKSGFLETVTRNRGQNLMVFEDVDEAKEWLLDWPQSGLQDIC